MTIYEQLDDLLELDSETFRLSDWEVEFIDKCDKQRKRGLSWRQEDKIKEIWHMAFVTRRRS